MNARTEQSDGRCSVHRDACGNKRGPCACRHVASAPEIGRGQSLKDSSATVRCRGRTSKRRISAVPASGPHAAERGLTLRHVRYLDRVVERASRGDGHTRADVAQGGRGVGRRRERRWIAVCGHQARR